LRYKGRERLFRSEWNAVVDALNDLYGWLTSGQQDIYVDEIYGRAGYFSESLLVQGRPVLKDGDPITVYQFYDIAVDQMTEAIDRSRATQLLEKLATVGISAYVEIPAAMTVQQFYDVAVDQMTYAVDRSRATQLLEAYAPRLSSLEEYARDVRDVVVRVSIDEYGRVGVRIAEPLDEYGRVMVTFPRELLEEFKPVYNRGGITATYNTAGFYIDLYKGGRPNVTLYYSVGGAATIYLKGSVDGMTWRVLETITTTGAEERAVAFMAVAYPYVRAETPTAGIDVEFELVASR
jgi:hypothetical protein